MEAKSDRAEGKLIKFYLEGSREPWQGFEQRSLQHCALTKMPLAAERESRRQSQEEVVLCGKRAGLIGQGSVTGMGKRKARGGGGRAELPSFWCGDERHVCQNTGGAMGLYWSGGEISQAEI